MDVMMGLFKWVGLCTNITKTKVMTYVPGKICTRHSQAVYNNSKVGLVMSDMQQTKLVESIICGKEVQADALDSHLTTQHTIYRPTMIDQVLLVDREPITYQAW